MPVLPGRLVRARLDLPSEVSRVVARSLLTVRGMPGAMALPASALVDEPSGIVMWLPADVSKLEVSTRNSCLLPLDPGVVELRRDEFAVLRLGLMQDATLLKIQIVAAEDRPVSGPWPLQIADLAQGDCPGGTDRPSGWRGWVIRSGGSTRGVRTPHRTIVHEAICTKARLGAPWRVPGSEGSWSSPAGIPAAGPPIVVEQPTMTSGPARRCSRAKPRETHPKARSLASTLACPSTGAGTGMYLRQETRKWLQARSAAKNPQRVAWGARSEWRE